jgi:hypothetical protein
MRIGLRYSLVPLKPRKSIKTKYIERWGINVFKVNTALVAAKNSC